MICASVGFLKYSLQVIDYATFVQPRFDKALETLVKDTIAEATETAIKAVRERLFIKLQAKKQGEPPLSHLCSKRRSAIQPVCPRAGTCCAHKHSVQNSHKAVKLEETLVIINTIL